jgi:hypothetical protein
MMGVFAGMTVPEFTRFGDAYGIHPRLQARLDLYARKRDAVTTAT